MPYRFCDPGPADGMKPIARWKRDRGTVARPGDRHHASRATCPDVLEEALVEPAAEAGPPVVRARADHVDIGIVGVIRADEPDQEPDGTAAIVLGDPRRPGEVLEPQAGEQLVDLPPAPPLIDQADEARMIGLGGAAEADVVAHRAVSHATIAAVANWSGTRGP